MANELKRRDLSGIFIFDTLPGDNKRKPTCIEDCTPEKRRKWCLAQTQEALRDTIKKEAEAFTELCDYLLKEKCITDEQRLSLLDTMDSAVERSRYNWAIHELADQVDFVCSKLVMLADACGVTKHKDSDDD